jgi:predicted DNA-binding transcriptional regulator AlpA
MTQALYEALLRKREVLKLLGFSNSTFYNRIKDGSIKPGVPIGPRVKAWPASEIQAYIQSCIKARDELSAQEVDA